MVNPHPALHHLPSYVKRTAVLVSGLQVAQAGRTVVLAAPDNIVIVVVFCALYYRITQPPPSRRAAPCDGEFSNRIPMLNSSSATLTGVFLPPMVPSITPPPTREYEVKKKNSCMDVSGWRRARGSSPLRAEPLPDRSDPAQHKRHGALPQGQAGIGETSGRYHGQKSYSSEVPGHGPPVLRYQPEVEDVQRRPHLPRSIGFRVRAYACVRSWVTQ